MHRVEVVPWSIAATYSGLNWSLPSPGELTRDGPRGLHDPCGQSRSRITASVTHRPRRAGDPDGPDDHPAVVADGGRDAGLAAAQLLDVRGPAALPDRAELAEQGPSVGDGPDGERLQGCFLEASSGGRCVGEDRLAQRTGVCRDDRSDLHDLDAVVGPEHVVHD